MRAVVIGGTGFLGLNLCRELQAAGHDVSATRRRSSNTLWARRLGIPLVGGDLDDPAGLAQSLRGCDVAFMAAGHYPRWSVDTPRQVAEGLRWLRNAYDAARTAGVARFVYTSSSATVAASAGGGPAAEKNGLAVAPDGSTYFAVKLALEAELARASVGGPEVVTLCPTGCLGPYDWKVGTGSFVLGVLTKTLSVFVDGPINVVDARDVARSHIAAAERGVAGRRYLLGGHDLTVGALVRGMAERFDVPLVARELSADEGYRLAEREEARCVAAGRGRPALTREFVDLAVHGLHVDSAEARTALGHRARPLTETLDDARDWYASHGYVAREAAQSPAQNP
ncbi:MAG: NAD-dependent epimerase/dehydratase family protein [Myxococcota bacterium]